VQLLKPKQTRPSQISDRVRALEPNIDPLLGEAALSLAAWFECAPQVIKHAEVFVFFIFDFRFGTIDGFQFTPCLKLLQKSN
jgi:hypothetical protein